MLMNRIGLREIFLFYWSGTLFLYEFGPFEWVTYEPFLFWGLNVIYIVFFFVGWVCGGKGVTPFCIFEKGRGESCSRKIIKSLLCLLLVNLVMETLALFRIWGFASLDFQGLINTLSSNLLDVGGAYNEFQDKVGVDGSQVVGGKIVSIVSYIWDFFALNVVLLSFFYFKRLGVSAKILAVMNYLVIIIAYLSRGTNIGVFRLILVVLLLVFLNYKKGSIAKRSSFVVWGIIGFLLTIVLFLFQTIMESRGGILSWDSSHYNVGGIGVDYESILLRYCPEGLQRLLVAVASYLTQGYYGMSLSLQESWQPMFGLGSSKAIQHIMMLLSIDVSDYTYQAKLVKYGWDDYVQWHTAYSWLANDVSYFGVIFVMFIFGYVFARAYKDCLSTGSPSAFLVLYYCVLGAIFLPCNNQVFQSTYTFFSFIVAFGWWMQQRMGIKLLRKKS